MVSCEKEMNGMKKRTKILLWSLPFAVALLLAAFFVAYFVLQLPLFDRSGWVEKGDGVRYLDYYGTPKTQWQTIRGARYYFSRDGMRCDGWQTIDGKQYYFRQDGQLHTGRLEEKGKQWYLTEAGTPYIGWLELEGQRTYYSPPEGVRHSGWLQLPEGTYYLDEAGHPQTGWISVSGIRYYLKGDGTLDETWQHDGKLLRHTLDGQPYSGWYRGEEGTFWFDAEGLQKTGWVTDETGRFYLYADGTYATGFVTIGGVERYFLPDGRYVILCNRWNPVPDDFEMNLVTIGKKQVDASCLEPLQQMIADGEAAGLTVKLNSAYRSIEKQKYMWNRDRVKYMNMGMSRAQADEIVGRNTAIPGTSEHHTGLAVDIFGSSGIYDWLEENCWKYGFILRYPDDKIEITGIIYEPWHFRYVGKELAKDIMESGLCLEEYLEMLKNK